MSLLNSTYMKKTRMRYNLLCLFLFVLSILSCEKDESISYHEQTDEPDCTEIRLGDKVESPFLLSNMQRAVDSLSVRSGLKSKINLCPTHLYVRFLPADEVEYDQLVADTTLDFDPYPLDRKLSEGDHYHDPLLPAEAITWQYSVVPVGYNFEKTNIPYEILDELYILDEDIDREDIFVEKSQLRSSNTKPLSWKSVVNEALLQTGNIGKSEVRAKWTPAATIMAYDNLLGGYIPLQGVKVRIRYFAFLKAYHYTDANGDVTFGSKRTSVEYSIEWERDMWDIRYKGSQAYSNGPEQKSKWNLYINYSNQTRLHLSAIHRALYKYYYGNVCGLLRPDQSLKVLYNDNEKNIEKPNGTTYAFNVEFLNGVLSSIKIYGLEDVNKYKPVCDVFSTTLHELTHASHCMYVGFSRFEKSSKTIIEAVALSCQWILTKDEYKSVNPTTNNDYKRLLDFIECQDWPYNNVNTCRFKRNIKYSPLIIDMIDNVNQKIYDKPLDDKISGYYMHNIMLKLMEIRNLSDFKSYVLSYRPSNVTESDIKNYFSQFEMYCKE